MIGVARTEFAQNPHDTRIQTKLKALLDLQILLQSQNLGQAQLMLVKTKVAELTNTVNIGAATTAQPQHTLAGSAAPTVPVVPRQQQATPILPVAVAPPPASAPPTAGGAVSLDSLFGQGALASLLAGARKSTTPQAASPYPPPVAAAIRSPPPPRPAELGKSATPIPSDPMALMAALRQSGLLPAVPGSSSAPVSQSTTPVNAAPPPISLANMPGLAALLSPHGGRRLPVAEISNGLELNSLKR